MSKPPRSPSYAPSATLDVVEVGVQDIKQVMETGNRYLLVLMDRATKFLFIFPLPRESLEPMARLLVKPFLACGVPLVVHSHAGCGFIPDVVRHVCGWMKVEQTHRPADHAGSQGVVPGCMTSYLNYTSNSRGCGIST